MTKFLKRLREAKRDEEGSSLIEVVVAIPLVYLLLGVIVVSMGVVFALQTQTQNTNIVVQQMNSNIDKLNETSNCAQLQGLATTLSTGGDPRYAPRITVNSCNDTTSFSSNVTVASVNTTMSPQKTLKSEVIIVAMR